MILCLAETRKSGCCVSRRLISFISTISYDRISTFVSMFNKRVISFYAKTDVQASHGVWGVMSLILTIL